MGVDYFDVYTPSHLIGGIILQRMRFTLLEANILHLVFEILETEAVVKGQTASSSYKPAVLTNGIRVTVPPHIETGDKIKIHTKELTYIEKSK